MKPHRALNSDMLNNQSIAILPDSWHELCASDIAGLAPVQAMSWPLLNDMGIEIAVKRDDLLGPELSGNKLYKLHGHILAFKNSGASALASFGGAYSNHIYALAAVGKALKLPTIGIIRGEQAAELSPTLRDALSMGMRLVFVSRSEYKNKSSHEWLKQMEQSLGVTTYWVPEGGGDELGATGCYYWGRKSLAMAPWKPTHLCVAAGTGATAAGILAGSQGIPVHAFLALKGSATMTEDFKSRTLVMAAAINRFHETKMSEKTELVLETQYHGGGYAKLSATLRAFMLDLEQRAEITLDPVYTAKLFWGIARKAEQNLWPQGSRLLVFHTGGVQGRRGYSL